LPYQPKARISASSDVLEKAPVTSRLPEIVTLPGMVIEPDVSIVSLATPPVTKAISPILGLIIPVLLLLANFKAQLESEPGARLEFVPSSLNNGKPPAVVAS